jgi:hypothetical protein
MSISLTPEVEKVEDDRSSLNFNFLSVILSVLNKYFIQKYWLVLSRSEKVYVFLDKCLQFIEILM